MRTIKFVGQTMGRAFAASALLALSVGVVGCGDDEVGDDFEDGAVSARDAQVDAPRDTGKEAQADATRDAATDVSADASVSQVDAGVDSSKESAVDAAIANDAAVDTGARADADATVVIDATVAIDADAARAADADAALSDADAAVTADTGSRADAEAGMAVDAGVESSTAEAAVDSGAPDAAADAVVDVAHPETGGDAATCGNAVCEACMAGQCPGYPTLCNNFQGVEKTNCLALIDCMHTTQCHSVTPLDCYCGTADTTQCLATTGVTANGVCKTQFETALGTTNPATIQANFSDITLAGGAASQIALCEQGGCPDDCFPWGPKPLCR